MLVLVNRLGCETKKKEKFGSSTNVPIDHKVCDIPAGMSLLERIGRRQINRYETRRNRLHKHCVHEIEGVPHQLFNHCAG